VCVPQSFDSMYFPPFQELTHACADSTAPILIWSEIEIHLAVTLSCVPAFKALAHRLFPGLLGSLGTRKTGVGGSYALRSRAPNTVTGNGAIGPTTGVTGIHTVIKSWGPRNAESLDSEEGIVASAQGAAGNRAWPVVQTNISIHSSSRESLEASDPKLAAIS
jgi:hypothetical protein